MPLSKLKDILFNILQEEIIQKDLLQIIINIYKNNLLSAQLSDNTRV